MGRSPCCDDESSLKKGPWTTEEDEKLLEHIKKHGHGSWRNLPKLAGLNRCGKSCRLRWTNYLRPDIKRGKFTEEEERHIIHLHSLLGNKWSSIASHLPGRTDNEIKNYWNTHLRKRLLRMGIDPVTHRPRPDLGLLANLPGLLAAANLETMAKSLLPMTSDDVLLRLQANEAMLKIHLVQNLVQVLTSTSTDIDPAAAALVNGLLNKNCTQFTSQQPQDLLQQDQIPNQTSAGNIIPPSGATDTIPAYICGRNTTKLAAALDPNALSEYGVDIGGSSGGDTTSPASSAISVPPLVSASPDYHLSENTAEQVQGSAGPDHVGAASSSSGTAAFDPWEGLDFGDLSFDWNWKDFATASASVTSSEMM